MRHGVLKLRFDNDGDGTGKLSVEADADGYSGKASAYFDISEIEKFGASASRFPLSDSDCFSISGGFGATRDKLEQEHIGIDIYPIDRRGHIGVQVRMATPTWQDTRPKSQSAVRLEIITTYEPLARFSKDLLALVAGTVSLATLEGEMLL
jgi:hypothetical protein